MDNSYQNQKRVFGFQKNVFWLGLVSFFNDFSSEMIYSVLPIFFVSILHVGAQALGTVEGIAEGFSNILKAFSGRFSDCVKKRKIFAVAGYALSVATRPFYIFTNSVGQVLGLRLTDRVGKGLRDSPRDALIADSISESEAGKSFGFHRALDTLGATFGPLTAFLILSIFGLGFHNLFLIAFFIGIFAILSFTFVQDVKFVSRESLKLFSFNLKDLPSNFYFWLTIVFVLSLGSFPMALVLLRVQDVGLKIVEIPLVYFLYSLTYAIFSLPAGLAADKVGFKKVIFIGYLIAALSYFSFIVFKTPGATLAIFLLLGVYSALTDGTLRGFTKKLIKEQNLHGTAMGLLNMTTGIGILLAGIIGGWLWQRISDSAAFSWGIAATLVGLILFLVYSLKKPVNA